MLAYGQAGDERRCCDANYRPHGTQEAHRTDLDRWHDRKTYDELKGALDNRASVLDVVLATLQLDGTEIVRVPLMNKDSLEMTPQDHDLIARTAKAMAEAYDGVVIVHGTDRLAITGERIVELVGSKHCPIVMTGAMRPYVMRNTDASQNLTEALLAVQVLAKGVYVVMHNKVLQFPGVIKDRDRGTFVRTEKASG